jgi:type I restriction enzyme S subunit
MIKAEPDKREDVVYIMKTGDRLPDGWVWARLGEVASINPRRPRLTWGEDEPTTFVPMTAVDEQLGTITRPEVRPFGTISRGYTYFEEGDVLFAKITPCMENGKHAVASGLKNGFGFGTTEFHVIRPGVRLHSHWLHAYLRRPEISHQATQSFIGTVGQQRVPPSFLSNLEIPLPPLAEQRRIVSILKAKLAAVERARQASLARLEATRALPAAYLRELYEDGDIIRHPTIILGEIMSLRREIVHPKDQPTGKAVFVGLEHIQSGTGKRTGGIEIDKATLSGRKPQYSKNDIVYGYLRPYLNKVWVAEFDGLCSVDQYVYRVREDVADVEYVAWYMRSPVYLSRAPVSATPGQLPRIRIEEVAATEINLPPLNEQRKIVRHLKSKMGLTEQLVERMNSESRALDAFPASLLCQAFSGAM